MKACSDLSNCKTLQGYIKVLPIIKLNTYIWKCWGLEYMSVGIVLSSMYKA